MLGGLELSLERSQLSDILLPVGDQQVVTGGASSERVLMWSSLAAASSWSLSTTTGLTRRSAGLAGSALLLKECDIHGANSKCVAMEKGISRVAARLSLRLSKPDVLISQLRIPFQRERMELMGDRMISMVVVEVSVHCFSKSNY
jgi:hypothetical protein